MAARKRTTRREKHQGTHFYDPKTKQHQWTLRYKGEVYRVKHRDEETARRTFAEIRDKVLGGVDIKGAGVRDLPVSDELIKMLREQCMRVGAMRPDALVFPGADGRQRQPNSVTQHFRRTCQRLGYAGYTLHSLRKYAVTEWRTGGVDLEVAAAMAGHRAAGATANTYSVPTMDRKRAAVKKKTS